MGTNIGIGNYIGKSKPQGSSFHPSLKIGIPSKG